MKKLKTTTEVLKDFKDGKISQSELEWQLERIRIKEMNLCGFKNQSGTYTRECSRGPGMNDTCHTCRVAAEWEEAYG